MTLNNVCHFDENLQYMSKCQPSLNIIKLIIHLFLSVVSWCWCEDVRMILYSLISAAVCCTSLVESFRDSYSFCILAASALVLSSSSAAFSGSRGETQWCWYDLQFFVFYGWPDKTDFQSKPQGYIRILNHENAHKNTLCKGSIC